MRLRNFIKRLFCKHDFRAYDGCDLIKGNDGIWKTKHKWKCRKCGKREKR